MKTEWKPVNPISSNQSKTCASIDMAIRARFQPGQHLLGSISSSSFLILGFLVPIRKQDTHQSDRNTRLPREPGKGTQGLLQCQALTLWGEIWHVLGRKAGQLRNTWRLGGRAIY